MDKIVLSASEKVEIESDVGIKKKLQARIDTGARMCSIDISEAAELELGPVIRKKEVNSASGKTVRPVVKGWVNIKGKKIHTDFTLIDRSHMSHPVLIGRNVLKKGFLVDVSK